MIFFAKQLQFCRNMTIIHIETCNRNSDNYIAGKWTSVARHCGKAHAKINRKMGNLTTCKIVNPENFSSKLCKRDYFADTTHHADFVCNRYIEASPQIGEILPLCDFLDCPACPVQCPLFSVTCPGRTARPIFTLYGSNDVFPRKKCLFGVRMTGDHIWGK